MGAGVRPEPEPLLRLRYLRETGQEQEAKLYEQYLADTGQLNVGRKEELADTAAGQAIEPDNEPSYGGRFVRTVLNAATGIPGVEAMMAGAGAVGSRVMGDRPLSYKESLETLREETGKIPAGRKAVGKAVGAVATLPFLPANPVVAGAALGAADQALDADESSTLERVIRSGAGAAGGAVLGKAGDVAVTGARVLRAKPTSVLLDDLVKQRAAASSPLYRQALKEGQAQMGRADVDAFLKKPDIAEIVTGLKEKREFAGMAADDPKLLDAIYKTLSDRAALAKRRVEAVTPNKPNMGRYEQRDIEAAKDEFLDVVSGGQTLPGPMPTYRKAVETFAEKSKVIDAAERGHNAMRSALNRNLRLAKNERKLSPQAFEDFLAASTPEQRTAAVKGVYGASKGAFGRSVRKSGIPAVWKAGDMVRKSGESTQRTLDDIIKLALAEGSIVTP